MWTCRMRAVVGDEHRRGGAAGPAATVVSAPAGGLVQRGCTPHFSFVLPKEKRAVHGPKRKAFGALRCSGPPRARGSAYRCKRRFCLTFGHARLFYEVDTAVPWRMVPTASGWLSHGPASIFAAAGCSSKKRERQRGESLRVSLTAPGCGGFPKGGAFPPLTAARDCQPSPAGGRRSAPAQTDPPNIFSFPPGAAHFLFDVSKRKWGAHPPWKRPPAGADAPRPPSGGPPISPGGGKISPILPRNTESAPAHTLSRGDLG